MESLGVRFVAEKSFEGLRGIGGGLLRFDFGIKDGDRWLLLEYDGPHHFEVVRFEGMSQAEAVRAFNRTKEHDRRKDAYCRSRGYPFLRVLYKEDGRARYLVTSFMKDNLGAGSSVGSWRVSSLVDRELAGLGSRLYRLQCRLASSVPESSTIGAISIVISEPSTVVEYVCGICLWCL